MTAAELIEIAKLAHAPTGDTYLDGLFALADTAIYYRFIYHLIRQMQPSLVVELGVCTGRCTAHMAAACPSATVIGLDPRPDVNDIKLVSARYQNIIFRMSESTNRDELNQIEDKSVDLCLVDSDHYHDQVLHEFALWLPKMKTGGVMLFDDITLDDTMKLAWKHLGRMSPHLRRVSLPELHHSGFGAILMNEKEFKYSDE